MNDFQGITGDFIIIHERLLVGENNSIFRDRKTELAESFNHSECGLEKMIRDENFTTSVSFL